MKFRHKITCMVAVQIVLIVASFVAIVHFESQTRLAGNVVNVAGKNRMLTIVVQAEAHRAMLHGDDYGRVLAALGDLEANILFLKTGGSSAGVEIDPVPPRFGADWDAVWEAFGRYSGEIRGMASGRGGGAAPVPEAAGGDLISLSDALTEKLGRDVDTLSSGLMLLQTALGFGNVAIHVLMIYLILRAFGRHAAQAVRAEKFAAVGELASAMAHDMKNPLGTIMNSATAIRGARGGGAASGRALDLIDRSVRRMSHQIDGVLNHVRDVPLVKEKRSVRGMLESSLGAVDVPRNVVVALPGGDAEVLCDPDKMEFVFANLVLNAIQAMGGRGGGITVRLSEGGGSVTLEFENSGPRIPEGDLPRIFEPLFTTKMRGTGLGLTSCRNVVRLHGGGISARNDPVTFTVSLPAGRVG